MQKDIIFQQSLSHKQLQNYHTNSKRNLGEIQAMIDALEKMRSMIREIQQLQSICYI
jgi:DNA anti-recombination protein RmuC